MSAQELATIIVGLVVLLILLFLYWNCRCRSEPTSTPRWPRDRKDELHGGQAHNRLQNAPPPSDHGRLIVRADELHGGQAQNGQQNAPPPPPAFFNNNGGTNSSSSGPDNSLPPPPPPPPPPAFFNNNGGTNSSSSGPDNSLPPPPPPPPPPPAFFNNNGGTNSSSSGPDNSLPPPPPRIVFTYEELERATDGFSDDNLLGEGGFGYVHGGVLPNGKKIAVKQLKSGGVQEEREFQAEVQIISSVHHRHLVSLVGYCISEERRLLVCEFVPNSTLHFHLHGEGRPTMDWPTRSKIALGSAKGLAYLHEDCIPKIIHRDIKGTNILLNDDFEVKIADFGLAKIVPDNNTHVTTRIKGTPGYLAPEYFLTGKLTDKSDVYSFGVMLLELITGRQPVDSEDFDDNLVSLLSPLLTSAIEEGNYEPLVDPRLGKNYNPNEMGQMVACAAACVRDTAKHRPRMSQVVGVLEGHASVEDLNNGVPPGQNRSYTY